MCVKFGIRPLNSVNRCIDWIRHLNCTHTQTNAMNYNRIVNYNRNNNHNNKNTHKNDEFLPTIRVPVHHTLILAFAKTIILHLKSRKKHTKFYAIIKLALSYVFVSFVARLCVSVCVCVCFFCVRASIVPVDC